MLEEDVSQYIPPPSDDSLVIWRYLDFTKYVALLESRCLFFARVSTLEDVFEGSFPQSQTVDSRIRGAFPPGIVPDDIPIQLEPGLEDMWKFMRQWASVNCWHTSEHESAAMWRLYGSTNAAIAICSTVGRLRQAIETPPRVPSGFGGKERVFFGMIDYINFESQTIPNGSFAAQFYRKRRSFEHERELRAMVLQFPLSENGHSIDMVRKPTDSGISVPVKLDVLIDGIRIAPQAPGWYADLVRRVSERYGVMVTPEQSALDAAPLY